MNSIRLILGTMQFGERLFGNDVNDMIQAFTEKGFSELDTAYVYNEGESERLIGTALKSINCQVKIATKVNPRITGRLDGEAVLSQCNESLERMHLNSVNTLYLHFPDPFTPIESALGACAQLYNEGKFKELGLSNFPAWLVAEVYNICKKNGWVLPTVYEGVYNPLSRHAERELNRALNYYGIRFYAYNPLAGGLLTDKYKDREIKEGRFVNRPNYQKRYWHDSFFSSIDEINTVCKQFDITIAEASYRWLAYHSMLDANRSDGIIIGASSKQQLLENISYITKGNLPDDVVKVIQEAWNVCKIDAPEYFTYYKPPKVE